jgi:hypothetical protein
MVSLGIRLEIHSKTRWIRCFRFFGGKSNAFAFLEFLTLHGMSLSNSVIYQGPSFRGTFLFIKGHRFWHLLIVYRSGVSWHDRLSGPSFRTFLRVLYRPYVCGNGMYVCMYAG